MGYVITAIEQQKNRKRVNIFINDEFAFGLEKIVAGWLRIGQSLSDNQINELKEKDQYEKALQNAYSLLSYRIRSRSEMKQRLSQKKYSSEIIEQVIDRLIEIDMINDHDFAKTWVESRCNRKPRSKTYLRHELRQKGIDADIISDVLENTTDDERLAKDAAALYYPKIQNLEYEEFRKKLLGYLARRGFSYFISNQIATDLWNASEIN